MTIRLGCMVAAFIFSGSPAFADSVVITPSSMGLGFVTCIQNTSGSGGCLGDPSATSAWWRVGNFNSFSSALGIDLLDVTLTFLYTGGSATQHWDVIPSETFVETSPFDISFIFGFTSLKVEGTLPQTTFNSPAALCSSMVTTIPESSLLTALSSRIRPLSFPRRWISVHQGPRSILLIPFQNRVRSSSLQRD